MDYLRYYLGAVIVGTGIFGFALGGNWAWLGIATYLPLAMADLLLPADLAPRRVTSPALADLPLYLHGALMIVLFMSVVVWAPGIDLGAGIAAGTAILGAIVSLAWLGAVPNLPVNHELMHRRSAFARGLASFLGTFYGDPSRDLAHVHEHHLLLGTELDGDTARRGDTIYNFALRCAKGAAIEGWRIEVTRLAKQGLGPWTPHNRVVRGYLGIAATIVLAGILGGPVAALTIGGGIVASRILVEAFNYYQHYGLVRVVGTPYDRRHLWNHLTPVSRMLGFEITNHSDHHVDPYMPYYALRPHTEGPQMPSIFVCFLSGIIPPIWFRFIAKPRLEEWDLHFASDEERRLAAEANRRAGWPDWFPA